jgi:hypothetical protein
MAKLLILILSAVIVSVSLTHGQGAFQNLDFEGANVSQTQSPGNVNVTDALPGWNAYVLYLQTQMGFDDVNVATGVPQIVLVGTNGVSETSDQP